MRGVDVKPPEFTKSDADEFALLDLRRWDNCLLATGGVDAVYAALGVANVAGAMTPLPGGIVGQELMMAVLISGIPGNSTASAMAMVGIMRLSTLWYAALLALPFFFHLSRRHMPSHGRACGVRES